MSDTPDAPEAADERALQDRNIMAVALLRFEQDERGHPNDRARAKELRAALASAPAGAGEGAIYRVLADGAPLPTEAESAECDAAYRAYLQRGGPGFRPSYADSFRAAWFESARNVRAALVSLLSQQTKGLEGSPDWRKFDEKSKRLGVEG